MGMDVYGKAPKTPKGEYFRNNVWWWRPLWDYCVETADDIIPTEGALAGHQNSGWGLDADGAKRLGRRLHEQLKAGHTKQYGESRKQRLDSLPNEPCTICGGKGRRAEPPRTGPGTRPCNACGGKGQTRPWETEYPFAEDNVREFANFLTESGGFEIH